MSDEKKKYPLRPEGNYRGRITEYGWRGTQAGGSRYHIGLKTEVDGKVVFMHESLRFDGPDDFDKIVKVLRMLGATSAQLTGDLSDARLTTGEIGFTIKHNTKGAGDSAKTYDNLYFDAVPGAVDPDVLARVHSRLRDLGKMPELTEPAAPAGGFGGEEEAQAADPSCPF